MCSRTQEVVNAVAEGRIMMCGGLGTGRLFCLLFEPEDPVTEFTSGWKADVLAPRLGTADHHLRVVEGIHSLGATS